jgi:hypothetical protein
MTTKKRLDRIRADVAGMEVKGVSSEEFARLLHETGGQLDIVKQKALRAYGDAQRAGAPHELACELAGKAINLGARRAGELVNEVRNEAAQCIALEFDHWLRKMPLDPALLRVARNWGYGDGRADKDGRTSLNAGRGIEDLKALLERQGCDLSGSRLKARRAPRR